MNPRIILRIFLAGLSLLLVSIAATCLSKLDEVSTADERSLRWSRSADASADPLNRTPSDLKEITVWVIAGNDHSYWIVRDPYEDTGPSGFQRIPVGAVQDDTVFRLATDGESNIFTLVAHGGGRGMMSTSIYRSSVNSDFEKPELLFASQDRYQGVAFARLGERGPRVLVCTTTSGVRIRDLESETWSSRQYAIHFPRPVGTSVVTATGFLVLQFLDESVPAGASPSSVRIYDLSEEAEPLTLDSEELLYVPELKSDIFYTTIGTDVFMREVRRESTPDGLVIRVGDAKRVSYAAAGGGFFSQPSIVAGATTLNGFGVIANREFKQRSWISFSTSSAEFRNLNVFSLIEVKR